MQAAPVITSQPQNVSACGVAATFTVTATGGSGYQWYESTAIGGPWTLLTNSSPYSGVTTNTLTVNPIASKTGFYYHCVISASCPITSDPALLTVTGGAPTITIQPAPVSVCAGENASFSVVSNGQTFQWQENTGSGFTNITNGGKYSGATTADLVITGVTTAMNTWQYQCIVTIPGCGSVTSTSVILTVNAFPVINTQPTDARICSGASHTFTVGTTGTAFQWQENSGAGWVTLIDDGITYSGTQTSALVLTNVPDGFNGNQYQCIVSTAANCSLTSNSATLLITAYPVISVQPVNVAICTGSTGDFSITAISTVTLTYQWQSFNGSTWSNTGTNSPSLTTGTAGMYRCIVKDIL